MHSHVTSRRTCQRLALAVGLGVACLELLRRPILTWGATDDEAAGRLPGDELLEDAHGVATRAITIKAPVGAVWPWLAQLGPAPRGGAYTYDWIENLLRCAPLPSLRARWIVANYTLLPA